MSLYEASAGVADPNKFTGSMRAIDLAVTRALGSGVLSGLTVDGTGLVSTGEALIGHVVALTVAVNAAALCTASTTNYVYLQMPSAPACVGLDGKDVGQIVVNHTGIAPLNAVLLATIVTGTGAPPSVTSVNTAPAGRLNLTLPLTGAGQSGQSLATDTTLSGADGVFGDITGASITTPGAGQYWLSVRARYTMQVSSGTGYVIAKLVNTTAGADVAGSATLLAYHNETTVQQGTASFSMPVALSAASTIKLVACRNGSGSPTWVSSMINSDANGYTSLSYARTL